MSFRKAALELHYWLCSRGATHRTNSLIKKKRKKRKGECENRNKMSVVARSKVMD